MLQVDHTGIVVSDLEKYITIYQSQYGFKLDLKEQLPEQKIELAFLSMNNINIELLAQTSNDSTISKFLSKNGEGLHHVCFKVKNIENELIRLENLGYILIDRAPRIGARNTQIAFIHPKSTYGMLIEICSYPSIA